MVQALQAIFWVGAFLAVYSYPVCSRKPFDGATLFDAMPGSWEIGCKALDALWL